MCGGPNVSGWFPAAESRRMMLCSWGKGGRRRGGVAVLQTQECTHVSEQLFAERSKGSAG